MNAATDVIANILHAHPHLTITLGILLGVSIVASRVIAPRWPIPPQSASKWERALHFLVVNWPAWGVVLGSQFKSLIPGVSVPFLSFTSRPPENPVDQARAILGEKKPEEPKRGDTGAIDVGILLCLGAIGFILALFLSGCGPTKGYVRALQIKGEASDALVDAHVGWSQIRQMMHDNIRTNAASLADGLAQLEKLRQKEVKADAALIVGREAVRKYSEALAATGAVKRSDWTGAILEVVTAITTMVVALGEFDVRVKWLPPPVNSRQVTQAIQRGFAREMARARKCYSFSQDDGGAVRFHQVGCELAGTGVPVLVALGGAQ
jgi:hypothetical protein